MFTRADYNVAARIAYNTFDDQHDRRGIVVQAFTKFFLDDNPDFDVAEFSAACYNGGYRNG